MGRRVIGKLEQRATFYSPTASADGYGGVVNGWTEEFTYWTRRQFLRGAEDVQAARLQGRQPVILTVRRDSDTETITTEWKAAIDGVEYNIRTVEPHEDRRYIDLLCESGVAV